MGLNYAAYHVINAFDCGGRFCFAVVLLGWPCFTSRTSAISCGFIEYCSCSCTCSVMSLLTLGLGLSMCSIFIPGSCKLKGKYRCAMYLHFVKGMLWINKYFIPKEGVTWYGPTRQSFSWYENNKDICFWIILQHSELLPQWHGRRYHRHEYTIVSPCSVKSWASELSNGIWHAYILRHGHVIYRWKANMVKWSAIVSPWFWPSGALVRGYEKVSPLCFLGIPISASLGC